MFDFSTLVAVQVQAVQHVLSSVEVYLPQRGTWQHAPDMHQARSALAAGWVAGGLYAVGGQVRLCQFCSICCQLNPSAV